MSHSTFQRVADPAAVVGAIAVQLVRTGAAGLAEALDALVSGTELRSAVLRRPGTADRAGEVLAVGGDVVRAVDGPRGARPGSGPAPCGAVVELPVRGPGTPGAALATLTVVGARPALLPALRALAAVVGLSLAAEAASTGGPRLLDADDVFDALEHDRDRLADQLHDGALQDLLVARLAADAAVRSGDARQAREAVQHALVGLRRMVWHLRPRGATDLSEALAALSGRLVEVGAPPLTVRGGELAAGLDPAVALAAYRVAQAVATAPGGHPVTVVLRQDPPDRGSVVLSVDGGAPLPDPDRWRRRLRALGGDLSSSAGRLRLTLPVPHAPTGRPASWSSSPSGASAAVLPLRPRIPLPRPAPVPISHPSPKATP